MNTKDAIFGEKYDSWKGLNNFFLCKPLEFLLNKKIIMDFF